ncbi:hypothetical protein [Modestobacter lacusdianchii]
MVTQKPLRAGAWQRDRAIAWHDWTLSAQSSRRQRLDELVAAVEDVGVRFGDNSESASAIIGELLPTLGHCDELPFDRPEQAVAYAMWHLPDRYARVVRALDTLFLHGHLPLRKTRMSVLEVGAGPAPAIYATSDYYSDLAQWCESTDQPYRPLPPDRASTLDRGSASGPYLHALPEALLARVDTFRSLPFGTTYEDLDGFSVHQEHRDGIEHAVRQGRAEADFYDEGLSDQTTREWAMRDSSYPPGAYDLIVMCNFLTTMQITEAFASEIHTLARSLTPGGVLLVLGSANRRYDPLWAHLEAVVNDGARAPINVLQTTLDGHSDPSIHNTIATDIIKGLSHLQRLAPETFAGIADNLPSDTRSLESQAVRFPSFRICAFKDERRRGRVK